MLSPFQIFLYYLIFTPISIPIPNQLIEQVENPFLSNYIRTCVKKDIEVRKWIKKECLMEDTMIVLN